MSSSWPLFSYFLLTIRCYITLKQKASHWFWSIKAPCYSHMIRRQGDAHSCQNSSRLSTWGLHLHYAVSKHGAGASVSVRLEQASPSCVLMDEGSKQGWIYCLTTWCERCCLDTLDGRSRTTGVFCFQQRIETPRLELLTAHHSQ